MYHTKVIQMKKRMLSCLWAVLVLASCSSPESDGRNLAQESCENTDAYIANTIQAYNNFIKEFSNKGYQTRIEAREELNKRIDEIRNDFNAKSAEIDDKFSQLLAKYEDDYRKAAEMINARRDALDAYSADSTMIASLRAQAFNKICSIIPPEPDKSKLMNDLVGRSIHAMPGGYFSSSWVWTIEKGEIKELQILDVKNIDTYNKEFSVDMILQGSGAAYNAKVKLFYELSDGDDWEIGLLEPSEVEIIKTGRYDNSITSRVSRYLIGTYLEIQNLSDGALLVGFQTLDSYGNWKKQSAIIAGGETYSHGILGYKDSRIDFVEKP